MTIEWNPEQSKVERNDWNGFTIIGNNWKLLSYFYQCQWSDYYWFSTATQPSQAFGSGQNCKQPVACAGWND